MKISKDGIVSEFGLQLALRNFEVKDGKLHPKMVPCVHRLGECTVSPCGKFPIFKWKCVLLNKPCDMAVSRDCNEPKS